MLALPLIECQGCGVHCARCQGKAAFFLIQRLLPDLRDGGRIVEMALDGPAPSPRELAVKFIDKKLLFFWDPRLRLLKTHDLITSLAFVVIKVANEFKDKTTSPREPA